MAILARPVFMKNEDRHFLGHTLRLNFSIHEDRHLLCHTFGRTLYKCIATSYSRHSHLSATHYTEISISS